MLAIAAAAAAALDTVHRMHYCTDQMPTGEGVANGALVLDAQDTREKTNCGKRVH